jgi:cell division protein FtsI/penicillin-binding protein 2
MTGFIGYAPADRPKLLVYVAMFDPKGEGKAGSTTSAPVFREIIEKSAPIFMQ